MERRISLCLTTVNRPEWTLRAFEQVLYDDRISEVVIVEDHGLTELYSQLENAVGGMDKVRLVRNESNLGCYHNKKRAIELASSEFCILLDSDNIIDQSYLDKIFEQQWQSNTILAPDMGEPSLNYRLFSGAVLTKENISDLLHTGNLAMMLNTANYFVNRSEYIRVFDDSVEPWTSDSIYQNYRWLSAGNKIHIVKDLSYTHSIHTGSHYVMHNQKNPGFYESVIEKLKALK